MASKMGYLEIVKCLLNPEINDNIPKSIHAENDGAFRMATKRKHTNIIKYLKSLQDNFNNECI
jgi:hypothetical protein